jgi:hypothetical protein
MVVFFLLFVFWNKQIRRCDIWEFFTCVVLHFGGSRQLTGAAHEVCRRVKRLVALPAVAIQCWLYFFLKRVESELSTPTSIFYYISSRLRSHHILSSRGIFEK